MRLAKLGDGRRVLGFKSMTPHPQLQQDMENKCTQNAYPVQGQTIIAHFSFFFFWNSKGGLIAPLLIRFEFKFAIH